MSHLRLTWLPTLAAALLAGCDPLSMSDAPRPLRQWRLLEGEHGAHWELADIPAAGKAEISDGAALLPAGGPMTGLRYTNWARDGLPLQDYAISYEALREEGGDFFAAITFPVRDIETCATLVVGGWGGALVGISSIDGQDAADNSTRSEQKFENGKWYQLRLEVRADELRAWIDDRLVLGVTITGRAISLRPGDIEKCAPFGLASYGTTGRVRNLVLKELTPRQ